MKLSNEQKEILQELDTNDQEIITKVLNLFSSLSTSEKKEFFKMLKRDVNINDLLNEN